MDLTKPRLWLPPSVSFLKLRKQVKTVTLPSGQRVKVTYEPTSKDNQSSVIHVERNEGIDAIVRPKAVTYKVRSMS